ncbi:hypothetical protein HPT25_03825 [Bacillus sp. BRMEA1]|uniref:hypothetical protein n=1 Tax=Neobacillus endophyticus TaxID=2738405 RepID=UPI0015666B05|nr:hypothetical protein [Neobacillus endophyticus]NRD76619.1 hypothetical protein [Neobacillus endophyticus]
MKWSSIRKMYPNRFVKLKALTSKVAGGKEIIEDVALIEAVDDEKATRELLNSKGDEFVYHTAHENIVLEIRQDMGFMRVRW